MLLEFQSISKSFGKVEVLRDISFDLQPGEVHVLAGENGAGKSTLMKIASGVITQYRGQMLVQGKPVRFRNPTDANRYGIAIIHQELSIINNLSMADNLFLGREDNRFGFIASRSQHDQAREMLRPLGLDIDVRKTAETFPLPVRQLAEIARALSMNSKVIIMDEPTSALPDPDVKTLFRLIDSLKQDGHCIVYISHKMQEIYEIADRITILRDGAFIATRNATELPQSELISLMVGRDIVDTYVPVDTPAAPKTVVLEVEALSVAPPTRDSPSPVNNISFSVDRGEILGFAGLQGSGCSEVLQALFGRFGRRTRMHCTLQGQPYLPEKPEHAVGRGIGLLTNDRKESGIVPQLSITENLTLPSLRAFSRAGWIRKSEERLCAAKHVKSLGIRCAGILQEIASLSGGNQQKVLIARWLETNPQLLLLDEPTRGVDVGAKQEIYELIRQLQDVGVTILLVTTEMPELLSLANRILVMHRGEITAELPRSKATQENILDAAMGGQTLHA